MAQLACSRDVAGTVGGDRLRGCDAHLVTTQHDHHHPPHDFDWDALADSLELDATMTLPIVDRLLRSRIMAGAAHVLDVGCGPGVVAVRLAEHDPARRVTAIDSSEPLLARARRRAESAGVGNRIDTLVGDLEHDLPPTLAADVIWASMVLHHVADPAATVALLRDRLAVDGTLVLVEFGAPATMLPPHDPLVVDGTWTRFQTAAAESLTERLGVDPLSIAWPEILGAAGFTDVTDARHVAEHHAPLADDPRAWVAKHIGRGLGMTDGRLDARDADALGRLADTIADRDDLVVVVERRVLTSRRA
jgi:SAM-dependent methyltransferase